MATDLILSTDTADTESENIYAVLGITKNAGTSIVKSAYRELVKQHHPDAGGDPEVFQRLVVAYSVLMDPDLRKQYDETGDYDKRSEESIRQSAYSTMMHAFYKLLDEALAKKVNLENVNIIRGLKKLMHAERDQAEAALRQLKTQRAEWAKLSSRLTRTSDGENLFQRGLKSRIDDVLKAEKELTARVAILERCIIELENYKSEESMMNTFGQMYGTSSSATFYSTRGGYDGF